MKTVLARISGLSFKPVISKTKHTESSYKEITKILYCLAKRNDKGEWEAHVNTKGLDGYENITILPFTEKSFDLKGRYDVFRTKKDKHNHWVRIIRDYNETLTSLSDVQGLTTLCENCVFSGYIVKVNGIKQFNMSIYQGTFKQCGELLNKNNKIENENEEVNEYNKTKRNNE